MAKSKSSASSGTRKKHARKAAGPQDPPPQTPKVKGGKEKGKGKSKEPRQKSFVAPSKPAPVQPDPLDTLGLASVLPPDLYIVLKAFGKKDVVTKAKALERLQGNWVDKCRGDQEITSTLALMLPVWLHHVPALFLHPSRRIRILAAGLHASLLQTPVLRDQIFFFLRESASQDQSESILGTWCMLAHDAERPVALFATKSWASAVGSVLDESTVIRFIQRVLLAPADVYAHLNPAPPVAPPPPAKKVPGRAEPAPAARTRPEEEEENEQDRNARLRVGAFGALRWLLDHRAKDPTPRTLDDLAPLLGDLRLWTSVHPAGSAPYSSVESFGLSQPGVRKAAWASLHALLRNWKDAIAPMVSSLSVAVLRSAWIELDTAVQAVMWQPLLLFLKDFPSSWELERAFVHSAISEDQEDNDSDASSDDEDEEVKLQPVKEQDTQHPGQSEAYREFLTFLELGCSGSPVQGYPTIVIILSTIPSSIIASQHVDDQTTSLDSFFTSFWAAVDGRALNSINRAETAAAFTASLLECTLFLVRRLQGEGADEAKRIVHNQFTRLWDELASRKLRSDPQAAGEAMAKTLTGLHGMGAGLFDSAWEPLVAGIKAARTPPASALAFSVLTVFQTHFAEETVPQQATQALIGEIVEASLTLCELTLQNAASNVHDDAALIVDVVKSFSDTLFSDPSLTTRVDAMVTQHAYHLLTGSPSLILAYLSHRNSSERCLDLWNLLLVSISEHPESDTTLSPLLVAAETKSLPGYLKPRTDGLDSVSGRWLAEALGPTPGTKLPLIRQILQAPGHFLSVEGLSGVVGSLVSSFTAALSETLRDEDTSLRSCEVTLDLLRTTLVHQPQLASSSELSLRLLPDVFLMGYLLPICGLSDADPSVVIARTLWTRWLAAASEASRTDISNSVNLKLRDILCDTQARPRPSHILELISSRPPGVDADFVRDILPPRKNLDGMLNDLTSEPSDPSLGVLDELIPPASYFTGKPVSARGHDSDGYSSYARAIVAALQLFGEDRHVAKKNMWALRHFLALLVYANDFRHIPTARSPVFNSNASPSLEDLISKVQQVTTYLLTASTDTEWHARVIRAISKDTSSTLDDFGGFVVEAVRNAMDRDNLRENRILYIVLQHVLGNCSKDEADQWVVFVKRIEKTAPQASITILLAITNFGPEPPRLDRYRNELAAGLLGVPPAKANTEGLLLLRRLAATAPDPDSDVVFLPQLRAVNVMKAFQQWIASDEDIIEDVESEMTLIFHHLAPILQNVPGSHWELIFDVIENNLETCSFSDDSTLVTMARTLKLVLAVQDLASTNKSLRADWQERQTGVLTLIRDMVAVKSDAMGSLPRSRCRELALTIVQDLPSSLIDENTLASMCHLLADSSTQVQKTAYHLLQESAKKRTEHLVIETGVDTDSTVKAELPQELIYILQRHVSLDDVESNEQSIFGYLLGWMIAFDLFTNSSVKVRSSYIDQLRHLGIISSYFIPNIFDLLNLGEGLPKAFKLDIWSVDEYYISLYETGSAFGLHLLAAHLYYRALLTVPSLIRAWILECKDKQLSLTVGTYTSQHFSPLIIRTELANVKSPEAMAELADENLTIKINSLNEIIASYLVDEQQLEIALKMPSDWPLRYIEVLDLKKVGVTDDLWRAWVLGVRKWSQNGHIVDALSLFKKNVAGHFEGQVECAICYSIISVQDYTLPRKPCKTCKNRFHSACLYKWFNTSHTSSCPLCRSDII
ncbi:hypothetical protein PLICRDRAFT_38089 [Plicaturopsis crispa FD-325 SS-3]|nr:hypothetical protein PLICRDRAFT_38089 [Plicaturopsis crispa FD-325 SS-3]